MEEKDLIKQLKTLKSIKPNQDWAGSVKQSIFVNEPVEKTPGFFANVFSVLEGHAVSISIVAFIGLVVVGGLFYVNSQKTGTAYKTLEGLLAKVVSESNDSQEMLVSLGELQGKLEGINMAIDNLKDAKDPNQALAMTEIVKVTAEEGKAVVDRIKGSNGSLSRQVLASLVAVEELSEELEQKSYTIQQELFEDYLNDLRQRSLSQDDQELLEKAEELYEEGREGEAMIFIARIGAR